VAALAGAPSVGTPARLAETPSWIGTVRVSVPAVAVTTPLYSPLARVDAPASVSTLLPGGVTVAGAKAGLAPAGRPVTARLVDVLKPS